LSFAMNDRAAFLDDDLGSEGLGAVFASPSNYRTHRLPYLCQSAQPVRPIIGTVRHGSWKYDGVVPWKRKWVKKGQKWYDMSLK
jgi:hypothetical protein